MEFLIHLIYWFAEVGAESTSLNTMFDPEVPVSLMNEEQ